MRLGYSTPRRRQILQLKQQKLAGDESALGGRTHPSVAQILLSSFQFSAFSFSFSSVNLNFSHCSNNDLTCLLGLRPPRLLGDPPPLHAQSEALRRQHHGAGPGLHPHHGRAPQAARLPAQRLLQLQVYSGCAYMCTRSSPSSRLCFSVHLSCLHSSPGSAPRRDPHLRVAAPHPPGGPRREDGVGEGGRGAGGGAGRPALQRPLSGSSRGCWETQACSSRSQLHYLNPPPSIKTCCHVRQES